MISARFLRAFSASRRRAFETVLVRNNMGRGPTPPISLPRQAAMCGLRDSEDRDTECASTATIRAAASPGPRGKIQQPDAILIFLSSSKPSQAAKDSGTGARRRFVRNQARLFRQPGAGRGPPRDRALRGDLGRGIDVNEALVGERWEIGTAVLEVKQPRVPCWRLGIRMNDPFFPRRFSDGSGAVPQMWESWRSWARHLLEKSVG